MGKRLTLIMKHHRIDKRCRYDGSTTLFAILVQDLYIIALIGCCPSHILLHTKRLLVPSTIRENSMETISMILSNVYVI
jgi:hypothetical protein